MIESPEDWGTFMDPDVFGETVEYSGPEGDPVPVTGIWTAAHFTAAQGFAPVSTTEPVFVIGAAQLPFAPAQGDELTRQGEVWRVADPQPDGSGLIRLILERD
ncbi:MAG: hypothetical protein AAGE03_04340 [Pseudomonadota bacterium]